MSILGLVLAGGRSSRFGSDKAEAVLGGTTLLQHALTALHPHCDAVAIAGRESGLAPCVADWPGPGLGPLGGIAGGLRLARDQGHAGLLAIPVDCVRLPGDLRALLDPAPSCIASQPVIGLWPVEALDALTEILRGPPPRSMRAFAEAIGARQIVAPDPLPNINAPSDLAALAARWA